jgi:hypothetical protein
MRNIILDKQKSREASEIATAVGLEKEKEDQLKFEKEKEEAHKFFITDLPEQQEEEVKPQVVVAKIPEFIIPFQETSFFIKHFGEVPIEVKTKKKSNCIFI